MSSAGNLSLVAGVLALDFANTASGRGSPTPHDHIGSPSDLLDWAEHAGLIDGAAAANTRNAFNVDPEAGGRILGRAVALREAIYRTGAAIAAAQAPDPADLRALRDAAQKALGSAELRLSDEGGYRFDFGATAPEAAITGPVALSALDFLATADFTRLKQCPGHGAGNECQWLFLDVSKNNSRRWCDMATCGNRNKSKRHRARRAGAVSDSG